MIKRISITLLFFAAFAVITAHSVIPHHHHEDETKTEHHDKDQHDDDDNGLGNLFSHFQHIGVNNQFVSTYQSTSVKQIDIPHPEIAFTNSCNFYFSDTGEPVPIIFTDHPDIFSSSGSMAFSLRGPPTFTI